jgi:hypothetical protein
VDTLAIYSGKVIDGKVIVKGVLLSEGTHVTILVPDDEEPFELTPDMEAEIAESIAEIERGEYVTWEELKGRLQQVGAGVRHTQD